MLGTSAAGGPACGARAPGPRFALLARRPGASDSPPAVVLYLAMLFRVATASSSRAFPQKPTRCLRADCGLHEIKA
jgi:hypothetical protein